MHDSPDNSLPKGMNPADLLRQGMRPDTIGGNAQHPFMAPSIEELAPLFPALDLIEPIGEEGMGAVYKARQHALDRLTGIVADVQNNRAKTGEEAETGTIPGGISASDAQLIDQGKHEIACEHLSEHIKPHKTSKSVPMPSKPLHTQPKKPSTEH